MDTKKDPIDLADEFSSNLAYMQTLLLAVDDKVQFYLSNKSILGPYWELLAHHAREIDSLLSLVQRLMEEMDQGMDSITDLLYDMGPQGAA